jgi:hypothetical protein
MDLWGLEGIVGRELDLKEENAASIWGVTLVDID